MGGRSRVVLMAVLLTLACTVLEASPTRRCSRHRSALVLAAAAPSCWLPRQPNGGCVVLQAAAPPAQQPVLQMAQAAVALLPNASGAAVGVRLMGPALAPVTANLTALLLPFRNASAAEDGVVAELVELVEPASVSWAPAESGVRWVRVRSALEAALLLAEELPIEGSWGAEQLVVSLAAATNADIEPARSSTEVLLVGADEGEEAGIPGGGGEDDAPLFGFLPNQVAYPPQSSSNSSGAGDGSGVPTIPVRLLAGQLSQPATLLWQLRLLTPAATPFLAEQAMQGVLQFEPPAAREGTVERSISVRIDWSRVPPEAEYRLGLQLHGFSAARVAGLQSQVALHVFGVPNGTCPPGSALRGAAAAAAAAAEAAAAAAADAAAGDGAAAGQVGVADLALSINGSVIDLSSAFRPSVRAYGAQVEEDVANVTLCLRRSQANATFAVAAPRAGASIAARGNRSYLLAPVLEDVDALCDCSAEALAEAEAAAEAAAGAPGGVGEGEEEGGAGASSCGYTAWQLPLAAGQNQFNITLREPQANGSWAVQQYALAVVRLSPPEHARLASITVKASNGTTIALCSSAAAGSASANGAAGGEEPAPAQLFSLAAAGGRLVPPRATPCDGAPLEVRVSEATQMVSVSPALLHPEIAGVRVEVNGRVLSRGGNAAADRLADTAGEQPSQQQDEQEDDGAGGGVGIDGSSSSGSSSSNSSAAASGLLPSAFIMGMQPGTPIEVAIVVVAEDGVTSRHYPLTITRLPAAAAGGAAGGAAAVKLPVLKSAAGAVRQRVSVAPPSAPAAAPAAAASAGSMQQQPQDEEQQPEHLSAAELRRRGWPVPPAQHAGCNPCPAGWAAGGVNASQCQMCPPGTASLRPQSTACTPCRPGTYAFSWGSTHCKHCIVQTYAPGEGSALCRLCPANWTNVDDGQATCAVPASGTAAAAAAAHRYAVVVSFSLWLSGVDPEDILVQAGVDAPFEAVVSSLVAADTAQGFNITRASVRVLGVARVARRTLAANVTATLDVELPANASEADIATALEVQRLSADAPIAMLSSDPDRFFGRTTKALDVTVESFGAAAVESRPDGGPGGPNKWALIVPSLAVLVAGGLLTYAGCKRSRQCVRWRRAASDWVATTPLSPRNRRYVRYAEA
eukprot:scaffold2.g7510.t1